MSKSYKISLQIIGLLVVGGAIYYFAYYLPKTNYIKENNIPANFLLKGLDFEYYQPQTTENLPVKTNEQIQPGARYIYEQNLDGTIKLVFEKFQELGWHAIAGSERTSNAATAKINNGKETLILRFNRVSKNGNEFTEVIILPIETNL